jgi:nucleoside-diphosphate-sugar epimerase
MLKDKWLITGANGFLGRHICDLFEKSGCEYYSLGKSAKNTYPVDLGENLPAEFKFDNSFTRVIHAAGKAHILPRNEKESNSFFSINLNGTRKLLDLLESQKDLKQFIFISTVAVYGLDSGDLIDETHPCHPKDPYGMSKFQAEEMVIEWCKKRNITYYIFRLPLIAGDSPPGNLGSMVKAIKKGYYVRIGKGETKRSVVLATELAQFFIQLDGPSGIYNLTGDSHPTFFNLEQHIKHELSLKSLTISIPGRLAKMMAKVGDLFGYKAPINSVKLQKILNNLTFSDKLSRTDLNWKGSSVVPNWKVV